MRYLLIPILALALFATACEGGTTVNVPPHDSTVTDGISVSGLGEVRTEPDIAIINIGIEASGATVQEARDKGADAANKLIASLKSNGVEEKDILTTSVNLYPQYFYSQNDPPRITGYIANNQLAVTVRDLEKAGKVIDDGVAAGGDSARLQGIQFGIDDPKPLLKEAREKAVADARARAETYAAASGVKLGAIVAISESSPPSIPILRAPATGYDAAAETPIQPGETTVSASVAIRFAIEP
ncbi:MAG: SIMPL domain-containing protein [Dehalococcoidia bacterium]|nr:SIMPL domain-containing protein [Dehalococcoidia bacterium]